MSRSRLVCHTLRPRQGGVCCRRSRDGPKHDRGQRGRHLGLLALDSVPISGIDPSCALIPLAIVLAHHFQHSKQDAPLW